jgi:hypothetical protein
MSTRIPVVAVESLTSYVADGHGSKQPSPPSGLHASGIGLLLLPSPHAASASAATTHQNCDFVNIALERIKTFADAVT